MNTSLYAPAREVTVASFEEALELANSSYAYRQQEFKVGNLALDGEGHIQVGNNDYPLTMEGMKGLCSRFRIPNPFAERIPYDLLKTNVLRLARDIPDDTFVAHLRDDGAIINVSKGLTIPPNNAEIIARTMRLFPSSALQPRINLGDRGLDIDLVNEIAPTVEARVGDPVKVGLRISTSEASFWTGYAKTLLYILRCTNGAVMPRSFGSVKLRIKLENNPVTVYNLFFKKVAEFGPNLTMLTDLVTRSGDMYFLDEDLVGIWKSITRMEVDNDVADMMIGLEEKDRENLVSTVKTRHKQNEASLHQEAAKPVSIKIYDVFDRVTSHALVCHQELRQGLQDLAGAMIAGIAQRN